MPATYESIASTTLTSTAATVSFTSISGSYTDLVLVSNPKMTTANTYFVVTYNSNTGSNYSQTRLKGDGSAASSARDTNATGIDIQYQNNNTDTGISILQLFNYANTTTNKTTLVRDNFASYGVFARVALWRSTSAITSITLTMSSSSFASGSTFSLYGIKSA